MQTRRTLLWERREIAHFLGLLLLGNMGKSRNGYGAYRHLAVLYRNLRFNERCCSGGALWLTSDVSVHHHYLFIIVGEKRGLFICFVLFF